jgi:hypothetical protein
MSRALSDFSTGTTDRGLYNLSGQLNFYPLVTGSGAPPPIAANGYAHVVLTRDAATSRVVGYVDGRQAIAFDDTAGDAVFLPDTPVRFSEFGPARGSAGRAGEVALAAAQGDRAPAAEVADGDLAALDGG